jgi:DNA-binding protein Fis
MVYDAVARHTTKVLSTEVFSKYIFSSQEMPRESQMMKENSYFSDCDTLPTLKASAEALIDEALHRADHNQKIAAAMLGITPPALSKRLKQRAGKTTDSLP